MELTINDLKELLTNVKLNMGGFKKAIQLLKGLDIESPSDIQMEQIYQYCILHKLTIEIYFFKQGNQPQYVLYFGKIRWSDRKFRYRNGEQTFISLVQLVTKFRVPNDIKAQCTPDQQNLFFRGEFLYERIDELTKRNYGKITPEIKFLQTGIEKQV